MQFIPSMNHRYTNPRWIRNGRIPHHYQLHSLSDFFQIIFLLVIANHAQAMLMHSNDGFNWF